MPPACYIDRIRVLSTAHLRQSTLERLLARPDDSPVAVVAPYPEGCFLYLKAAAGGADQSDDLCALYHWVQRHRYHWIRLDADGDQVPDLPVFDW